MAHVLKNLFHISQPNLYTDFTLSMNKVTAGDSLKKAHDDRTNIKAEK